MICFTGCLSRQIIFRTDVMVDNLSFSQLYDLSQGKQLLFVQLLID
jgi:hypothetical protein